MKCKQCKLNKHMSLFPPKTLFSRRKGDLCFECFKIVNGKTYQQYVSELVKEVMGHVSDGLKGI